MRAFIWIRTGSGYGLKQHASPGFTITDRVVKWKDGTWNWMQGAHLDSVVRGPFKTLREAKDEVEKTRGLSGKVCAHCGSPMAQ